ncbi:chaperone modulator CbpM [Psychromonas sp. SP041]|uniref:chaperone modulator CbpM n=1 Tax=Psychromonas sp. SP041 TaxID=1365007 RepID=UPI000472ABF6|nr:chaperone modulator CbpM [Psychromonas sp. SP041]
MMHRLTVISLSELCQLERIESHHIIEIVENGIVKPIAKTISADATDNNKKPDWEFETASVYWIKKAVRLHQDLEIDWLAVALLIDLIQQRDALQKENAFFKQQLSRFTEY